MGAWVVNHTSTLIDDTVHEHLQSTHFESGKLLHLCAKTLLDLFRQIRNARAIGDHEVQLLHPLEKE